MARMYTFTVEGNGDFPLDMLRYDACWPASGEDVNKLVINCYDGDSMKLRTVTLYSHSVPTGARWASFLWKVISIGKRS